MPMLAPTRQLPLGLPGVRLPDVSRTLPFGRQASQSDAAAGEGAAVGMVPPTVTRRPMSDYERTLARKLWAQVRFPAAGTDKAFAQSVAFLATLPIPTIPDEYGARLRTLRWRYRRQLDRPITRRPRSRHPARRA
jgi:hypothetical protein